MTERGNELLEPTQGSRQGARETSRSQEIETLSFHEEAVNMMKRGNPL